MESKEKVVWTKRNRSKWHWIALFGAIGIGCVTSGMMQNASGITIVPLAENFGIGRGEASSYLTIMGIVMGFIYFFSGILQDKIKSKIWLPVGLIVGAAGLFLPYIATSFGMMRIAAVLMAIMGAFCGGSFMCGVGANWFKNSGLVVGIINATTTGMGAVWSLLGSFIIEQTNWRMAFLIEAILVIVFAILSIFLFRFRPEEKGLIPYGAKDDGKVITEGAQSTQEMLDSLPGVTAKHALRTGTFWFILIFAAVTMAVNAMSANLPGLAVTAGMSLTKSGLVGTLSLVGWVIGSLVIGALFDKMGMFKAGIILGILGVIGCSLLLWHPNDMVICIGAFIFGLPMGFPMVGHTEAIKRYLGGKNYATISSWANAVLAFSYYSFVSVWSSIYDASGTYDFGLILCIVFLIAAVVLMKIIQVSGDKLKEHWD